MHSADFVQLVLGRLMQSINPQPLLKICKQQGTEPLSSHFIKQWLMDTDCFLGIHDRKLYVLGLCTAIGLGENKPVVLNELADKVLPSLILIFEGLKRAYQARAQEGEEEESDEEDDDADCEGTPETASISDAMTRILIKHIYDFAEALSSDEDEVDEMGSCYLENVKNFATKKANEMGLEMSAEVKVGSELHRMSLDLTSAKLGTT